MGGAGHIFEHDLVALIDERHVVRELPHDASPVRGRWDRKIASDQYLCAVK